MHSDHVCKISSPKTFICGVRLLDIRSYEDVLSQKAACSSLFEIARANVTETAFVIPTQSNSFIKYYLLIQEKLTIVGFCKWIQYTSFHVTKGVVARNIEYLMV